MAQESHQPSWSASGPATTSSPASGRPSSRPLNERVVPSKAVGRLMRIVRRVHLYSGLLLMPWVLLFGVTALSFNHPKVGRGLEGQMLPPARLQELTGITKVEPESLAEQVVEGLGDAETQNAVGPLSLVDGSARLSGWPLFVRPAPGGREVVILGLDQGRAILTHRKSFESQPPPFAGKKVPLQGFSMETLAAQLEPLHDKLHLPVSGPLRPHPKIHPELRFVARDAQGVEYNVVYDLSSQTVDGRLRSESRHAPVVELLEQMHKQHHYPANFGPSFFWALFADLTALCLVVWALSGLAMWWQLKKLRVYGAAVIGLAIVLASLVMGGTAEELSFGPERSEGGP